MPFQLGVQGGCGRDRHVPSRDSRWIFLAWELVAKEGAGLVIFWDAAMYDNGVSFKDRAACSNRSWDRLSQPRTGTASPSHNSYEPFLDDLGGFHTGQALVEALELVAEAFVLEAHGME